jgi:hypothetical protein
MRIQEFQPAFAFIGTVKERLLSVSEWVSVTDVLILDFNTRTYHFQLGEVLGEPPNVLANSLLILVKLNSKSRGSWVGWVISSGNWSPW